MSMDAYLKKFKYLLIGALFLLSNFSNAEVGIVVVSNKNTPVVKKVTQLLQREFKNAHVTTLSPVSSNKPDAHDLQGKYVVSLGDSLPEGLDVKDSIGTIGALVSKKSSEKIALNTAVFVEPPLYRQFLLAQNLNSNVDDIGLLVQDEQQKKNILQAFNEADRARLVLNSIEAADGSLNRALHETLKHSNMLLGIYDNRIYNAATIKNILITSYRQNKVLIGPSKAYLKAGSFATTHSDLKHVSKRLAEIIKHHQKNKQWLAPDYNPYFKVLFNRQVARSLNINVPDAKKLEQVIREAEL